MAGQGGAFTYVVQPAARVWAFDGNCNLPTASDLLSFTATAQGKTILLRWETALEFDIRGFQLWRSTTGQRADAVQLTQQQIPSRGTAATGAAYQYTDITVHDGAQYTYWLQEVQATGMTIDLATISVQQNGVLYLPLVSR